MPPDWRRFWGNSPATPVIWLAYGLPGVGVASGSAGGKSTDLELPLEELVGAPGHRPDVDRAGPVGEPGRSDGVLADPAGREDLAADLAGVGVIGVAELGP